MWTMKGSNERKARATPGNSRMLPRAVPPPVQEPLGHLPQGQAQGAVAGRVVLDAQVRQRLQQGELVGGHEIALLQQPLQLAQERDLVDALVDPGHGYFSQYAAFAGMTCRTPPRGSSASPR